MTAARRQPINLRDDLERAMNTFRIMSDALLAEADDLQTRFSMEPHDSGSKLVMVHCMKALRLARGLPMAPHTRATIDGAYKLVCRQLGEIS